MKASFAIIVVKKGITDSHANNLFHFRSHVFQRFISSFGCVELEPLSVVLAFLKMSQSEQ